MAAELATSARILLLHFKSKEGLLQEVMQEPNERSQNSLTNPTQPRPPAKRAIGWEAATLLLVVRVWTYQSRYAVPGRGTISGSGSTMFGFSAWFAFSSRELSFFP